MLIEVDEESVYRREVEGDLKREFREYNENRIIMLPTERPFCTMNKFGQVEYSLHMGQRKVMQSKKRIIAAIAGRQGGKSAVGAPWLHEEMRDRGPGLYMVVAPSYPLLTDSAIPKIEELFDVYYKYGKMRMNPLSFKFTPEGEKRLFRGTKWANTRNATPTVIRFGHAANPESLEAKTALAAWLDEAGQDGFKMASWEAVQGRLTTTMGRVLITTTPYNLGWLKTRLVDPWQQYQDKGLDHPDIDVIPWASVENPAFSRQEYERLRETMPFWKWDMFYNGSFTVPAGLIYGVMKEYESDLKVKRINIPFGGPKYGGLDFGGPNTCAVMATKEPKSGDIFLYRTYYPGYAMNIGSHVKNILRDDKYFDRFAGGAKSESSFRDEFWENGLRIEEPGISDVQGGIDRLYGLISQKKFHVAEDLIEFWNELYTYQYETDPETGDVKPDLKIKSKSRFHHMDATRYLATLFGLSQGQGVARAGGERTAVASYRDKQAEQIGFNFAPDKPKGIVLPDGFTGRVARSNGGGSQVVGRRRRRIDLSDD